MWIVYYFIVVVVVIILIDNFFRTKIAFEYLTFFVIISSCENNDIIIFLIINNMKRHSSMYVCCVMSAIHLMCWRAYFNVSVWHECECEKKVEKVVCNVCLKSYANKANLKAHFIDEHPGHTMLEPKKIVVSNKSNIFLNCHKKYLFQKMHRSGRCDGWQISSNWFPRFVRLIDLQWNIVGWMQVDKNALSRYYHETECWNTNIHTHTVHTFHEDKSQMLTSQLSFVFLLKSGFFFDVFNMYT